MAGVSSATLEAWAIPLAGAAIFDHTYAVSSCGLRWGCRGRSTGGVLLRGRVGSSAIADCLAGPNAEAGILYGLTGVCHQMANRILHSAGITVVGCGGYAVSIVAYGPYGRPPWPELQVCYSGGTVANVGPASSGRARQGNLSGSGGVPYPSQSDMEQAVTEFLKLAEGTLGRQLDQNTRRSLRTTQKDYMDRQHQLVHSLEVGALTPEEYLDRFNALLKTTMDRLQAILGDQQFFMVFGEAGRHPEGLVDRGTFMDAIAAERAAPQ